MLTKSDMMYDLPTDLIAQHPPKVRGTCRLMVVNRRDKTFYETEFSKITEFVSPTDSLVLNNTKVIPARLSGKRKTTGGAVELLLLENLADDTWKAMVRPGRSCRKGNEFVLSELLTARVTEELGNGRAVLRFFSSSPRDTAGIVRRTGTIPIPPYIKRAPEDQDYVRYQTVFAEHDGAVAAPTAGLHFTPELLKQIADSGTTVDFLTLHVGPGTFQPLRNEILSENTMDEERFHISGKTLESLRRCRKRKGRIIAVGTTVVRALESIDTDTDHDLEGSTSIFIHPPYEFRNVDALLTNFHLPGSSLIALVASFTGLDFLMSVYRKAIEERFYFYSYGDAMLIL